MALALAAVSGETGRQIALLINRRGEVHNVIAGTAEGVQLPNLRRARTAQRRFRGLRCVHTHLKPGGLSREDLMDLALLRLDTMSVLDVDRGEEAGLLHTAHLVPDFETGAKLSLSRIWTVLPPCDIYRQSLDFDAFIRELEAEFARKTPPHWQQEGRERAILAGVATGRSGDLDDRMRELRELALSSGADVLDQFTQTRPKLDARYLLGRGKLQEIIIRAMQLGATMLIFDHNLSPTQARNIGIETDLKVIDRTQLILDIFARRAQSMEGKIQVELAQLTYLMPRLVELDDSLSRLSGGIGGRGPGETMLEVDRRRLKDRMAHLRDKLKAVRNARGVRRQGRRRQELPVVSIVGYTNAGKSTLLNALTRAEVVTEDRMFATLDPVSRRLALPYDCDILLSDTVGFIRDLPPALVEAFTATLEEIQESQLLVHLADAASPTLDQQLESVAQLLTRLDLDHIPRLLVFNKVDCLPVEQCRFLAGKHGAMPVSALTGTGLENLADQIRQRVRPLTAAAGPAMMDGSQTR